MGKNFPRVKFGYDSVFGRRGIFVDDDAGTSTVQSGYELKEYDGEYMDQLSINYLEDLRTGDIEVDRHADEEEFRAAAGVVKA